jgi:hypothetical protein
MVAKDSGKFISPIRDLKYISAPKDSPRHLQVRHGLKRFFKAEDNYRLHAFRNYKYIVVGDNATPTDPEFLHNHIPPRYTETAPPPWINFMIGLQKYHIVDAISQLGLEKVFENTAKCNINHTSLLESCSSFACMERRWAFTKVNKEDIGMRYFVNKGK